MCSVRQRARGTHIQQLLWQVGDDVLLEHGGALEGLLDLEAPGPVLLILPYPARHGVNTSVNTSV